MVDLKSAKYTLSIEYLVEVLWRVTHGNEDRIPIFNIIYLLSKLTASLVTRCPPPSSYHMGNSHSCILVTYDDKNRKYILLTKREVKMAGYWPSSLFNTKRE